MSNNSANKQSNQQDTLMLYHFVGCPFCSIATAAINRLGLNVELRDTMKNPQYRDELVKQLGRGTVPVLRIIAQDGSETWMPESRDIERYLEQTYG
ncbi:glutathione S-transferase N-terminal domain-containing protein [Agarivorans sp. MS3-6]|uniref:glutathione S-transferase N-terminal domain-containing protein n=1 Tax=Agarivorans sp. TSD2052 TaxID=2937286 RepID=UPI00200DCF47|nr:glutathione S-transferase N-terminal domain-containing protein [Agarivorans sp. TSD2052]UPW19501.1 glutathione S-transferase N-terminal domain-containing protein [Agarivorans sp. TSD2052]